MGLCGGLLQQTGALGNEMDQDQKTVVLVLAWPLKRQCHVMLQRAQLISDEPQLLCGV